MELHICKSSPRSSPVMVCVSRRGGNLTFCVCVRGNRNLRRRHYRQHTSIHPVIRTQPVIRMFSCRRPPRLYDERRRPEGGGRTALKRRGEEEGRRRRDGQRARFGARVVKTAQSFLGARGRASALGHGDTDGANGRDVSGVAGERYLLAR